MNHQSITQKLDDLFARQLNSPEEVPTHPEPTINAHVSVETNYPMPNVTPIELSVEAPTPESLPNEKGTSMLPYEPSALMACLSTWNNGHGKQSGTTRQFSGSNTSTERKGKFLNLLNRIINK